MILPLLHCLVPDCFIYTGYSYFVNPNDPCCFRSTSQQLPFFILISKTVHSSEHLLAHLEYALPMKTDLSAERLKSSKGNSLLLLNYVFLFLIM